MGRINRARKPESRSEAVVNVEFVGEPREENGFVCADLRWADRLVPCRFTEGAVRLDPPAGDGTGDALLDRFRHHRDRFRALASRKAATIQGGLSDELTISEADLNR